MKHSRKMQAAPHSSDHTNVLQFYIEDEENRTKNGKGFILKDLCDWPSIDLVDLAGNSEKVYLELGGGSGYVTELVASSRLKKFGSSADLEGKLYLNDLSETHIQEAQKRISAELLKQIVFVPGDVEKALETACNKNLKTKVSFCLARRMMHFVDGKSWPVVLQHVYDLLESGGLFAILTSSYYMKNLKNNIPSLDAQAEAFNQEMHNLIEGKEFKLHEFITKWDATIPDRFTFDSQTAYGLTDITGPTILINEDLLKIIAQAFGFEIIKSGYVGVNDVKEEDRSKDKGREGERGGGEERGGRV